MSLIQQCEEELKNFDSEWIGVDLSNAAHAKMVAGLRECYVTVLAKARELAKAPAEDAIPTPTEEVYIGVQVVCTTETDATPETAATPATEATPETDAPPDSNLLHCAVYSTEPPPSCTILVYVGRVEPPLKARKTKPPPPPPPNIGLAAAHMTLSSQMMAWCHSGIT